MENFRDYVGRSRHSASQHIVTMFNSIFNFVFRRSHKENRRIEQPEESGIVQRFRWRLIAITAAGCMVCVFIVWGWFTLENPDTLPITTIEIQGEFHYLAKQQIQQTMESRLVGGRSCTSLCGGFFNIDVDVIRDVLLEIPWVNTATVRRVWPDTLQIVIVEQLPIARWGAGGLVNSQGQLFFPLPETYPPGLPELQGPVDSQTSVAVRYREMEKELDALALHINRIVLDERRSWKIEMDSGVTLLLGRVNDNARLTRFTRLYPVALAAHAADIEQVDLRYTNGFSVRWKT